MLFNISVATYCIFIYFGFFLVHCTKEKKLEGVFYCQESFVYPIIIIISILNGVGASLLWVCQGFYMNKVCSFIPEKKG